MLAWRPAPRRAEGPMSTPRRLWPRSMGTPMMRTFCAMCFPQTGDRLQQRALRIHAINHAREGDDLANVFGAANPCDGALKAHSEAGMRNAAVAAQVEIPLEGLRGQVVFVEALDQQIVIMDALASADNFAVTFLRDHVKGAGEFRALGVRLHVKGFD